MSWSVNLMGHPAKVADALRAEAARLTGNSRAEYEAAVPHLIALVVQNFGGPFAYESDFRFIEIEASGGGSVGNEGVPPERTCSVTIKPLFKKLVR